MQRAGTAATLAGALAPVRGANRGNRAGPVGEVRGRPARPSSSLYVERALLLWPRLDRAKLRRYADDPTRIAELVERRTAQPFEAILAMLTRQAETPIVPSETTGYDLRAASAGRIAIRIVSDDSEEDDLDRFVFA